MLWWIEAYYTPHTLHSPSLNRELLHCTSLAPPMHPYNQSWGTNKLQCNEPSTPALNQTTERMFLVGLGLYSEHSTALQSHQNLLDSGSGILQLLPGTNWLSWDVWDGSDKQAPLQANLEHFAYDTLYLQCCQLVLLVEKVSGQSGQKKTWIGGKKMIE